MEEANKTKMDVEKYIKDLMDRYSFDDVKELFHALNNDILEKELYKRMFEDLDKGELKYPHC